MYRFFVDRPVFAIVLSMLLVLLGAVAITRLPIEQYPDVVPPQVLVNASYVGADAETVANTVAAPIEQQLSGVDGLIYMQSTNSADGTMGLRAIFEVGSDPNISSVLTQNRISQATSRLPAVTQRTGISIRTTSAAPLLVIGLQSPNETFDPEFLANYAQINISDRLLGVPGVGDVRVFGGAAYAMRIWLNPSKLTQAGLTPGDVREAIATQSEAHPIGLLGGPPAEPGTDFTYTVTSHGRLTTEQEFSNILLKTSPDGARLRLGDVARVELGADNYFQQGRLNGVPSAALVIYQAPESNALATADGVRETMDELAKRFPEDMRYRVSLDSTASVRAGIHEIVETLVIAVILVIAVVYLFLENAWATLIPAVTVPVSLVGACMAFPLVGFSINTLSLFGLVLAIGIVVDDAIVVVEATQRKIEHGLEPREATLAAMAEVSGPVIATAIILAAVFIPVAFAGGITGMLYQQFALTIAFAVLLSAVNALTLSPALCARLLHSGTARRGRMGRFFDRFDVVFGKTTSGYMRFVHFTTRKLGFSLLFLALFAGAAGLLGLRAKAGYVPAEDQGYLFANFALPPAASLDRTNEAMREVEEILSKTEGIDMYTTISGYSILAGASAPYYAVAFISLKPWDERKGPELTDAAIAGKINAAAAGLASIRGLAMPPPAIPGLGTTGGFSLYVQDIGGTRSAAELGEEVGRFVAAANERPELSAVMSPYQAAIPQRRAVLRDAQAQRQGVDIGEAYDSLGTLLGSGYVNQFNRFGRTWNVYVQADTPFRGSEDALRLFSVRADDDRMVPLNALFELEPSAGPQFTNRFNLYNSALVVGSPAEGYSSGQALDAVREVADEVLPRTMGFEFSDLSRQQDEAGSIVPVFALAILSAFLILAALYESWSLPFAVLLGTPIAMAGAFVGLKMRALELDVYAQIGLILLVGLAAKNAILIVEYARAQVQNGKSITDAAAEAAELRFRPIVMTSVAFILGCLPLWVASGAGSIARQILGTVVIVGMIFATVFGTLIVPALFVMIEKASRKLSWKKAKR